MSEMSNRNVSNNGMNEAGMYNEDLLPDRYLVIRSVDPVVIKLQSKKSG